MKLEIGSMVPDVVLHSIDGEIFNLDQLNGRSFMLSFFRFASCPFCNLRVHELGKRYDEFGDNFTIVAIFDSPLDNLILHSRKHHSPFTILADEDNKYFKRFGIEYSFLGVIKGSIFRFPTLLKAMLRGYLPLRIKGKWTTMPADFLVDQAGIIKQAYYGNDEGDHLLFDEVKNFSHGG